MSAKTNQKQYGRIDNMRKRFSETRFTIVQLLTGLVIIAVLAVVGMIVYNEMRSRDRNAQRAADISQIKKAILAYDKAHGSIPTPKSYYGSDSIYSDGDASVDENNWLSFLRPANGDMPVDPVNTIDGDDPASDKSRTYYFYCNDWNPDQVVLGYHTDAGDQVLSTFNVSKCAD